MPEMKICIFRNEDGSLESWLDLKGLHKSCDDFERSVVEQFDGISILCSFSITPKDLKPNHQQLFFALFAMETAMEDSDDKPTHLLEEIIDKVLEFVKPAILLKI